MTLTSPMQSLHAARSSPNLSSGLSFQLSAGSLIVQEAGGLVQMPLADGKMDYNLSTAILSANSQCMPTALKVFRETVFPDLRKE